MVFLYFFFFFQAEDGIRDVAVTGVQTCALPISIRNNVSIVGSQVASALRGSQAGLLKACDSNVRGPINGLAVFCGIRAEEQTKVLGHKAVVVVVKELVEVAGAKKELIRQPR